jgi:hypothetical protein
MAAKSKKAKLTPGLAGYLAELELGDFHHLMEVTKRLADLPEFGLQKTITEVERAFEEANNAEAAAKSLRLQVREKAKSLFEHTLKNWSLDEIEKATGYTTELD